MHVEHRELMHISSAINIEIDETFEGCLKRAFVWANEMGIKGHKVSAFNIKKGSEEPFCHPTEARHTITCNIFHKENHTEEK